jgi:DNA-binding transcriptional LysR family regulator
MHVTLRQLQIFRAVALTGSTTAAAVEVHLSQSATSAALNELERALREILFDRVGKRLILNDSGRDLLPMALAVLDGARSIETAFISGERAAPVSLELSASTTIGNYLLPGLLARFSERVPSARLQVQIGNSLDVVTAVRAFAADLGFIEGPCHAADMIVMPLWADELVIVASSGHPLAKAAKRRKLTGVELREARWLTREPGSGTREAVERALLPHLQHFRSTITLGSSESIKNAAAEGLGVACLSRCIVQDLLGSKKLAALPTELPRLTRQFSLVYHQTKVLSASLRRFISHCESYEAAVGGHDSVAGALARCKK